MKVLTNHNLIGKHLKKAFEDALAHEEYITKNINELTDLAIAERDHSTKTFLQWYVDEQVEEEAVANENCSKI